MKDRFYRYLTRHLQVLVSSLGRLLRHPGSTVLTVSMLGITLALPAGLYVFLQNLNEASFDWTEQSRVSVYLAAGVDAATAAGLASEIAESELVTEVNLISPEEGLREFKAQSQLGTALDLLDDNPLPFTLVVTPEVRIVQGEGLQVFLAELQEKPLVAHARVDLVWLQRLQALTELAIRAIVLIGILLCVAVAIIISNTIRLDVLNRQDEIDIISRIGGTGSFIRRPFLYSGALQGLFGAIIAVILIEVGLGAVAGPIRRLVGLYHGDFSLQGPGLILILGILGTGAGLGWLASRITLEIHLRRLLPQD